MATSFALFALFTLAPSSQSHLKAHASIVTSVPPNGSHFDFIVIGGGTAGLALSARLSAHTNITVLTIEAGLDNRTDLATESLLSFRELVEVWHFLDSSTDERMEL